MRLVHLGIENFKGIKEIQLDFKPGFNLLVGENGVGKTSILEAIAVSLGGFIAGIPQIKSRNFSQDEIRKEYYLTGDGSCAFKSHLPMKVEAEAVVNDKYFQWKRFRESEKNSYTTIQPRDIAKYATQLANSVDSELPLILYESASRLWQQRRDSKGNQLSGKYPRTIGYNDALKEASNQKLLINWCIKMEIASFRTHRPIEEYEAVKRIVSNFMTIMNGTNDNGRCRVFFDVPLWEMMYEENGIISSVSSLSAGYQSLVWMVFDIAYRMAILNPHLAESIGETKGIVLVDELDMHLHPKWQWQVINALTRCFPNIQFIATTHAPTIIVSAKDIYIIGISENPEEQCFPSFGLDINTAIKLILKSTPYPPEIEKLVNQVNSYMDSGEYVEAEKRIAQLNEKVGENSPLITDLNTRLDIERIDLED